MDVVRSLIRNVDRQYRLHLPCLLRSSPGNAIAWFQRCLLGYVRYGYTSVILLSYDIWLIRVKEFVLGESALAILSYLGLATGSSAFGNR